MASSRIGSVASLRATLIEALRLGIGDLGPARLVAAALPPRPPKRARVLVIAAGKAAPAMAEGALRRWPSAIARAIIVTTDDLAAIPTGDRPATSSGARVDVYPAAHPIPDARSAAAAEVCLAAAGELRRADLLVALVSGGTSAVLALPPRGLSLADKRAAVARLLSAGVSIRDVNTVRRHLSRIKGGRLAAAAGSARVLTLIVSDVIDGEPHDIGSGPTAIDPTSIDAARSVLARASPDLLSVLDPHLTESLKRLEPGAVRNRVRIVAGPDDLARRVAEHLRAASLSVRVAAGDEGDAATIARRRVDTARSLAPGDAVVTPSEPTLTLPPAPGRGGRAGWTALAAAMDLPDGCVLLCAASDGVDGSSGAAGAAIARADVVGREGEIERALADCDDAPLHRALGTHVVLGPTGTNMTDVHVVARAVT